MLFSSKIRAFSRYKKSHFKLKLACFKCEKSRNLFFREIFRSQSIYYIYQANEKQNSVSYTLQKNFRTQILIVLNYPVLIFEGIISIGLFKLTRQHL